MSFNPDLYLAGKPQAAAADPSTFDPDAYLAGKPQPKVFDPDEYLTKIGAYDTQSDFKDTGNTLLRSMHEGIAGPIEGVGRMVASAPEMLGKLAEGYTRLRQSNGADSGQSPEEQAAAIQTIQANTAQIRPQLAESGMIGKAMTAGMGYAKEGSDVVQGLRQKVDAALPIDKDFAGSTFGGVTAALGQIGAQMPAMLTGLGLPTAIGQMYDQGYQDAKQHGADEGTAAVAGLGNMPQAALEFAADKLQLGPVLDILKKGKGATRTASKMAGNIAGAAATEAGTEAVQQVAGNVVAKGLYDEDRELTEGMGQAALVGGIAGGGIRGGAEGVSALLDSGMNVQESKKTLEAQQAQLLEGTRPAMMFPANTKGELELPDGFERIATPRGIFHYNPALTSAEKVKELSAAGRENEILNLGSVSKPEAMQRAAAGDPLVSITERDADGNEVRAAAGNESQAARTAAEFEATKTNGNTVAKETPTQTILERIRADIDAQENATREAQEREQRQRDERQAELRSKQEQFDSTMAAARSLAADQDADYTKISGALASLTSYAEDNSLGIRQDQRNQALAAIAKLEPRAAGMRTAFEAQQSQRAEAAKIAAQQEEQAKRARIQADRAAVRQQAAQGIGADGQIDYGRLKDNDLETRATAGDKRAERELMQRAERPDDRRESLLDVLTSVKLPATDGGLAAELKILREDMTPAQQRSLINKRGDSLDRTAEALRGRGFRGILTPDDVITFTQRALRGEDIRADQSGGDEIGDVSYATDNRLKVQPLEVLTEKERAHETRFTEQLNAATDAENDARYKALPDSKGGMVLNTDIARELDPQFKGPARAELSRSTHRPAGRYVRDLFSRTLKSTTPAQIPIVRFLAGGGGSGKSTVLKGIKRRDALTYDTTFSAMESAITDVQEALDAGRVVALDYVHRPIEAATIGAVYRTQDPDDGRTVPLRTLARAHYGAQQAILAVARHFKSDPRVSLTVWDNSGPQGSAYRVADAVDFLQSAEVRYDSENAVFERAKTEYAKVRESLTDAQRAAIEAESNDNRRVEGVAGEGSRGVSGGTQPGGPGGSGPAANYGTLRSEAAPRILTDEQVSRQWETLKTALGPVAEAFDLRVGIVAEVLQEEGYTREAGLLRSGKIGAIQAATAPRARELITETKAQRQFIVVAADAARQEKAPGLLLHELAHPFFDSLPSETKDVLREMHQEETQSRTGPLYKDGELQTDIAITADDLPRARVAADPDLPVKEWFAERTRRLNEAWLEGRMSFGERPLLARVARQLLEHLKKVWAQMRGMRQNDDLFTDTFQSWLTSGTKANIAPEATAYAQRQRGRVEMATRKNKPAGEVQAELSNIEGELKAMADGVDQADPADLEARGKALQARAKELRKEGKSEEQAASAAAAIAPASNLSEGARDAAHPAAVGPVEPGETWASVNKLTPEQLREEQEKIGRHFNENTDEPNVSKALLWQRVDALKAEAERRAAEKADPIAKAPRVKALPVIDRKAALLTEWRRGKALRDEGLKTGNETAEAEGQRLTNRVKALLDDEFPGWEKTAYPNKKTSGSGTSFESEDDGRNLPDEPETEYNEKAPALEDPAPPIRAGKILGIYGNTAHVPSFTERSIDRIRKTVVGIRGSIPELPAFPALARNSDRFIREKGDQFYNRLRAFYRALKSGNDYVQRTAEEQVAAITKPLLDTGESFPAADLKRLQKRQGQLRALRAEGKSIPPGAAADLEALNNKLEANPYVLFNRFILALDLDWRHRNLKDSAGNPIRLPNGVNGSELGAELSALGAKIEASPHKAAIAKAVDRHMALVKEIGVDLKGRELLAADHLNNPFYFPHLTLEIKRGDKTIQRELEPERVRVGTEADFRGYLVDPVGSAKPIETDYIRALYYHLVQVGAHNLKADAVRDHVRPYDIRKEVDETAKQLSREWGKPVSWETAFHDVYEPQGYVLYGTDSRDAFPTVMVDRDKLARRLGVVLTSADLHAQLKELGLRGITLQPDDLKETLIQGQRETWVVPARVAESLRGIADRQHKEDKAIEAALKGVNSYWKRWKLFMPQNHIRYEYGNVVADLEKLWSASPRTFKYLGQSAKEMRAFFQGEAPSEDLRSALKDGVINAVTAQEMNQLQRLRSFEKFETFGEKVSRNLKKRASSVAYQPITNLLGIGDLSSVELSALREGITRYANYLANLEAIRNNARPDYAGAYWRDIEAIGDSSPGANDRAQRQAAQISKATFGDYGDLSVTGEYLRDKLIPFYSWMEVNFKYHANLFRNLRDMVTDGEMTRGAAAGKGARAVASLAVGVGARAAGGLVLRLALPYAAMAIWNNTGGREELEDKLSEEDRRRAHIILGEDEGGKVNVIYGNTALADVMKWFSGPKMIQGASAWMSGRTDFMTAFDGWRSDLLPDLVNNTLGSAGPIAKIGVAAAFKKTTFPDVLNARTIPSYDLRRNIIGQATDDFSADLLERIVNKDYAAQKDLGTWAKQLILQIRQRDPEQWAFYGIKEKADQFKEKWTGEPAGDHSSNAKHLEVLRNFRKAIFTGDIQQASRFYLRLLDYGYTAEKFASSLRSQEPLSGLSKKNGMRQAFIDSLDGPDRTQLERAGAYYAKISGMRGSEKLLFPSEKGGTRGLELFRQDPKLDRLRGVIERQAGKTDESIGEQIKRDLARSLKVGR